MGYVRTSMRRLLISACVAASTLGVVSACGGSRGGGGSGGGDDDDGASDCSPASTATGSFTLDLLSFDVDESTDEGLTIGLTHKIDIDLFEAGCIAGADVVIRHENQGCELRVGLRSDGSELVLDTLVFEADSFCPQFPDSVEGSWVLQDGGDVEASGLPGRLDLDTGTEETFCLDDATLRVRGDGVLALAGDGSERPFAIDIRVDGDLLSTGSTEATCEVQGDDDDAVGDDDDAVDDDDAADGIVSVHPADGATGHFVHEIVWVEFEEPPGDASITLEGPSGAADGTSSWITPRRLKFAPHRIWGGWGVTYGSNYDATVQWDGGSHSWEFQTSADGSDPDFGTVTGQTYLVAPATGAVIAPASSQSLVAQLDVEMLVRVDAMGIFGPVLLGAPRDTDGTQNECSPSFELNGQPGIGSWFETDPVDVPWLTTVPGFGDLDLTLRDLVLSGWLDDRVGVVDEIVEGQMSFTLDLRDLGFGSCADVAGLLSLECMLCPHDPGEEECVLVQVLDMESARLPSTPVEVVTPADIANDGSCN